MTTITADQKAAIREAVLKHLRADGDVLTDGADELQETVESAFDDTVSRDDTYQAVVAADMQTLLEEADERDKADDAAAAELDFSSTDVVRPGAIVGLDGVRFIVGVVLDEVTVDGQAYAGLSDDSPLYEAIQGLSAGDSYTFRDQTGTIDFVA